MKLITNCLVLCQVNSCVWTWTLTPGRSNPRTVTPSWREPMSPAKLHQVRCDEIWRLASQHWSGEPMKRFVVVANLPSKFQLIWWLKTITVSMFFSSTQLLYVYFSQHNYCMYIFHNKITVCIFFKHNYCIYV